MNSDDIVKLLGDPQIVSGALVAVSVAATVYTIATPLFSTDTLERRMKSVATERERIRARERAAAKTKSGTLRHEHKRFMKDIVDRLSLSKWLSTDNAKMRLASAGFRGPQAETAFLFFRAVTPIAMFIAVGAYLRLVNDHDLTWPMQLAATIVGAYVGIKFPELYLTNTIQKRQFSMRRAFPDSLDLMLICVESGMSIEHAFRKVGQEVGVQSPELAEEFALATAELSFLPDRRSAYLNLVARTGLDGVKQICTVLIQAEKYGTPLGQALRVTAQESRDMRMMEAEKMAAGLPPKLTVPMIIFFLPVLLVVVMAPAVMQVMAMGF
jgi:tight adherence protein C